METYKPFKRIRNILTGWGRSLKIIKTPIEIEKLSKRRLSKCEECKSAKTIGIFKTIEGKIVNIKSLYCSKCNCPCLEKSLVRDEQCPLNKW